ncbi:hypothetical protein PRUPE_7G267100 [Prunus persica]|uniref:Uncharacterized protein n=1 Tax=Prunus persica TaxID=3760 RepID=A0A251NHJ4_PRUPE|nr:hypothetical protein PRUPE_7G267100 [Prunus persica]ONH98808.1 hypothetical protein PRUPE_7G267100 [Prunus persica]
MAKENESASQATVNGDNTLTRSTMSSIGIGRGCVLLRETHRECTRHRWCRPRVPHSWRDDRLVLIMGYVSCRIMVIFSSVEHQYVAVCSSV